MTQIRWIESAGNEGGPFLIGDVDTLATWTGEDEEEVEFEVGEAAIGKTNAGRTAVFWDMYGAGTADIGVTGDADEIVLLRSWVDDEADHNRLKDRLVRSTEGEQPCGLLETDSDIFVVCWSPVSGDEISDEMFDGDPIAKELRKRLTKTSCVVLDSEGVDGIGVAFIARPGRYRVRWFCNYGSDDDITYCVCRLTRDAG